jgi:pSer/pThr/pTyr-binding forkhead associated (FHA) protein
MPRLIMRRGPTPGAIYELEGDTITIGRGSKNDIIIRDNEVSREHCNLRRVMDDYEVQDLNSSNGTFVNGQRVQAGWLLQSGAIVEFGDTITMEYERILARRVTDALLPPEDAFQDTPEPIYQYSLMVTMGPEMGQIHRLDSLIITVGRDLSNDIAIQDPEISRFHMRLRRGSSGYTVEDMGSTNGTFVNGVQITQPYTLEPDDVIRLARQVRLQYIGRSEIAKTAIDETVIVGSKDVRVYPDTPERIGGQTAPLALPSKLMTSTGPFARTGQLRAPETLPKPNARLNGFTQPGLLNDTLFVAYARTDWEGVVSSLVSGLQQAGMQSWVDQYLVQHGDDWRTALEQALSECWAIVVVVSAQSLSSNYVKMAYRYFVAQQKPLISFILEPETTLPPDLTHGRAILYDRDNPQRSYHKLILEVMHLRK